MTGTAKATAAWHDGLRREAYTVGVALLVAMAVGSILILAVGQSPGRVYWTLLSRSWGDLHGLGQVLFKSTPLIFTGLAVALAFRAGLFNIGAEGQMIAGGFATGLVAAYLPGGAPSVVVIPLAIATGMAAGGVVGAVPGILKARYGAHEVINTIMLNFIVASLVLWLGNEFFFAPESTHTRAVIEGAEMPGLGIEGSPANLSFVLSLLTAAAVWFFLTRSRRGFEFRAVGFSPDAAENGGVHLGRTIASAMALSGAIAGMVGANFVLGYKHYFEEGMGRGAGFMGIAVALLGRNHPAGIVFAALLFGTLDHGGFVVSSIVPKEIVEVLVAMIILAIVATSAQVRELAKGRG